MPDKNIKLSQEQIRKMKHAIGLDNSKAKNGKYSAYRNHYATSDDAEWNEMVSLGLATKRKDPFCADDVVYHVSDEGYDRQTINKPRWQRSRTAWNK